MTKNIAIVFAGGVGSRMGATVHPKQFLELHEKPILVWTLECFESHPQIDEIFLACKSDWIEHANKLLKRFEIGKVKAVVPGGETAQHSIYNALTKARECNSADVIVLLHDGVRPFITSQLIDDLIKATQEKGNAITSTPCNETIVVSDDNGSIASVPLRRQTLSVQAPQAFYIDDIIDAHKEIRKTNPTYDDIVDACTMYSVLNKKTHLVRGNIGNIKITKPEDVFILKGLMEFREEQKIFV